MFGLSFRKKHSAKRDIAPGIKCNNLEIVYLIKKFLKNSQWTINDLPEIFKKLGFSTPCTLKKPNLKKKEFEIEFNKNHKLTFVTTCKLYNDFPNKRITIKQNGFQNWIEFAPQDTRSNLLTIQHQCTTIKNENVELICNYFNLIDDLAPIVISFSLKYTDNYRIDISLESILLQNKKDITCNIIKVFNSVQNYLLNFEDPSKHLIDIVDSLLKQFKLPINYLSNASISWTDCKNEQLGKIKWKNGKITEYKTVNENAILTVFKNSNWNYKDDCIDISKTDTTYDFTIDKNQIGLINYINISDLIATIEGKLSELWKWVK